MQWTVDTMRRCPDWWRAPRPWISRATNLANAGTPGYRSEQEYFRSVLLGPEAGNSQLGRTVNNFGVLGRRPAQHEPGRAHADW